MNDGGPAFPEITVSYGTGIAGSRELVYSRGMSLRDWYVGQALNGMLAGMFSRSFTSWNWDQVAEAAGKAADAMLKARESA